MSGEPKTGDRLLVLVIDDIQYIGDKFGVQIIGWCTDDGPDGKKMRRLLRVRLPWMIVVLCWAHQINLIVGDILRLKLTFLGAVKHANEVIKWFNVHGTALALLRAEQKFSYDGKFYALVLPVVTRWTAHYLSITRLLKLKGPVKSCCSRHEDALLVCAGSKDEAVEKAQFVLNTVGNDTFWANLVK
jgi:hypothetical protein